MTLEELFQEWEEESNLHEGPIPETYRTPKLHIKYYKRLVKARRLYMKMRDDFETLEFKKSMYYMGKASASEYKEKPFNHRVLKTDLPIWLKADKEIQAAKNKLNSADEIVKALTEIVEQINDRKWHVRNINQARQFEAGG